MTKEQDKQVSEYKKQRKKDRRLASKKSWQCRSVELNEVGDTDQVDLDEIKKMKEALEFMLQKYDLAETNE